MLNHDHAIVPMGAPVSETVAVAKKDIAAGEKLDGIGGFCVRGVLELTSIWQRMVIFQSA